MRGLISATPIAWTPARYGIRQRRSSNPRGRQSQTTGPYSPQKWTELVTGEDIKLLASIRARWQVQVKKRQKKGTFEMVQDGESAPDFSLEDDTGSVVHLSKLRGRPVIVYFYPKDDTSGCTQEAKDFSCLADDFAKAGAELVGISPDSAASHKKFKAKHDLTLRLLADDSKSAAEAYGVWVEKSMYGRKYMGVERSTFLIDSKGKIVKSWRKVKIPGHAEAVLAEVKALGK
jgi:peroxiredoxin Q/BCP